MFLIGDGPHTCNTLRTVSYIHFMHENLIFIQENENYMYENEISMHENEMSMLGNEMFAQKCSWVKIPHTKFNYP